MKLLTRIFVLLIAMTITVSTLAQSPNNSMRQRRTGADGAQQATDNSAQPADSKSDNKADSDKVKTAAEVTADGKTNRADQDSDEEAIVPYYNNFFTNYRLG